MKNHRYQVTVEYLEDPQGNPVEDHLLRFPVSNHDEIIGIVERIRGMGHFERDEAAAFAVGLKLFSEVMLQNKHHPLFTEFRPHFIAFMKKLKASTP